jgi:hypothetical protein
MPSPTTPLQVITDSLNLTRAVGVDETLTSLEVSDGLRAFNDLVENWNTQKLAVYGIADQTFTFVAGTGTYTIGTGGTFNTTRPERINSPGYTTVATGVTLPCTSMTQQEYDLLPYKTQQNSYPWRFLYVNSYPLGILTFWPVPSEANTITLAIDRILTQAATATTSITYPPGYIEAFKYNLAPRLAALFGKPCPPDVLALATSTLADIKRANKVTPVMRYDPATFNRRIGSWKGY